MTPKGAFVVMALAAVAGCAETLPEHDNRVFTAVPVAKLSAADLVKAFTDNDTAARDRFVGQAIEVSGVVRDVSATVPVTFLLHAAETGRQVRISMHEDRAAEITKSLTAGQRITLRCFCEGAAEHIQLKSCVVP